MNYCKHCNSKNIVLYDVHESKKAYTKPEAQNNQEDTGHIHLVVEEYVCMDCGHVYKKMTEDSMDDFTKYKEYFH